MNTCENPTLAANGDLVPLWCVIHAKPRCEKKAAEFCSTSQFEHVLPCYKSVRKYQRKTVTFEKPLFPGYVFVKLLPHQKSKVSASGYVVNLLTVPDQKEFEDQLNAIICALDSDQEVALASPIQKGTRVRIKYGPLRGQEGYVENKSGYVYVLLSLDFIGQAASVKVCQADIEVV
jgi:transcription antitermination factor NusG